MGEEKAIASTVLDRINASRSISKANKKYINDFVTYLLARNAKRRTVDKYVYHYEKIMKAMGGDKDLMKADKEEVERALAKINALKLSDEEKRKVRVTVKVLYKHFLGEGDYYPRQVAWIRTGGSRNRMLPQDLLSEADVLKLIESGRDIRDKALVALLFDTGMRIGELAGLRKKDIDLDSEPAHVTVSGKTGMRKVPILFSAPYVTQYLGTLKNAKPDDSIWLAIGTWGNTGKQIGSDGIRQMLKRLGKKAKIGKRVYPHLFRHSRATYYANRLTEQQLKSFFGWTGDSRMVSTYVHMSGRDIDDAVLQAYGKKPKEAMAPKLTEKICPRCRYANGIDFLHCQRCGAPLDMGSVLKETEVTGTLKEEIFETLKDPKFQREILKDVEKRMKKRKGN